MFGWFKKKKYTNPNLHPDKHITLKEIIYTTARNRNNIYRNVYNLGNASEIIYERVLARVIMENLDKKPLSNNIIDRIQEIFIQEECKEILIHKAYEKEYGM